MISIDGKIRRIMHHKTSGWNKSGTPYLIAALDSGITVKGEMGRPVVGETYRFWGDMRPQKGGYPDAFEFITYEEIVPRSVSGMADYLQRHIDGVGEGRARAIVEAFGEETLDILRGSPDRIAEVPGLPRRIAAAVRQHFAEGTAIDPAAYARLVEMFADHHISRTVIKKLLSTLGSGAPDAVLSDPYQLLHLPGVGWQTTDGFALTTAGYDREGILRHAAAIHESFNRFARDGHTYSGRCDAEIAASGLLGGRTRRDAWDALVSGDILVDHGEGRDDREYGLRHLARAEDTIASLLGRLMQRGRPLEYAISRDGLGEDQKAALDIIEANPVCLLIGPPGCGKSYLIARVVNELADTEYGPIRVMTPTGKAARRAAELIGDRATADAMTGTPRFDRHGVAYEDYDNPPDIEDGGNPIGIIPCTTIHRALRPRPSLAPEGIPASMAKKAVGREEYQFTHNQKDPINARMIVVDESSMVDVSLGASLLRAITPGTRVVFVGDENQLPSVGPGAVLRDLIAAGVPTACLTEIKRSDGGGRVVRACHAIRAGRVPEPASAINLPTDNWVHIEAGRPCEIAGAIVDLHTRPTKAFDRMWDRQVVTPERKRPEIGCDDLNDVLSAALNPKADDGAALAGPGRRPPFRVGDKVVRRKNGMADLLIPLPADDEFDWASGKFASEDDDLPVDWRWDGRSWSITKTDVVNGDLGEVAGISIRDEASHVVVRFRNPERLCRLPLGECHLEQAYAMTAHVAQGSGYPIVYVPVHDLFYWDDRRQVGIFNREWIYTAISRAESLLVTVGQFDAIRKAVGRKTVHRRNTRLAGLLRERIEAAGLVDVAGQVVA